MDRAQGIAGMIMLFALTAVFGQSGDFVTSGTVVGANGQPIPRATVTYTKFANRLQWDFSDANGKFGKLTEIRQEAPPQFALSEAGPVTLEVFDMHGRKLNTITNASLDKGTYSLQAVQSKLARGMYVVKIQAKNKPSYLKFFNSGLDARTAKIQAGSASQDVITFAAASASISDTVRIGKTGYTPVFKPISSYSSSVGTVTLQAIDVEGQVTSIFNAMSAAERMGQCRMPMYPYDGGSAASNRVGSVFGGGGAFSTSSPSSLANWMDGVQRTMVSSTPQKVPILLSYDGVHGMDVMNGTGTILPHNMGMGAIQDSTIVMKGFRVAALEDRGTGCNWIFGPCIAVVQDDRWGRSYEGFSESAALTVKMARWSVAGLQLTDLSHPWVVAATCKHFAGDGGSANGVNPGQTTGTDATAAPIHLPGYVSAVNAGVAAIMPSFSNWCNGVNMHANSALMLGWLKQGQTVGGVAGCHFDGFLVGDWDAPSRGGVSNDQSMTDGLDVPMNSSGLPSYNNSRVNDACQRVLRVKVRMNLMNQYITDRNLTNNVACAAHRDAARACVRASLVLLKNQNNALPIPKNASVHVCGPGANDVGRQCGGWTANWQGFAGNPVAGTTILTGAQRIASAGGGTVTSSSNGSGIGTASYVVAVLSEEPYAETSYNHISLTQAPASGDNAATINNITSAHALGKKVIVVLMAGRILDISPVINNCDAFVWASLPGTEGDGIPQVLYRDQPSYNFTGKLPFTFPTGLGQEPINQGDGKTGLFAFGFGLSYP